MTDFKGKMRAKESVLDVQVILSPLLNIGLLTKDFFVEGRWTFHQYFDFRRFETIQFDIESTRFHCPRPSLYLILLIPCQKSS